MALIYNNSKKKNNQYIMLLLQKVYVTFACQLAYGVTGNTSGFGPEESRFDP